MPNAFLPRAQVHAWSESIGNEPTAHSAAITRLLKEQRRLSRFVEENSGSMQGMSGGVAMYLIGVITRMFDLAGGRLRKGTWEDVRAAQGRVNELVDQLLPVDDGLVERARNAPRAQPHILDEALYALFIRETPEESEEQPLDDLEAFKIYLLMWVATEVLDANWQPPSNFEGDAAYTHAPVADDEVQSAAS